MKTTLSRPHPLLERLRRLGAAGAAALVLALTIFAASPVAHQWLHVEADDAAGADDCAVVLFASGVPMPLAAIVVPLPSVASHSTAPETAIELFLQAPRYLRQPERGPPAAS